MLRRVTCVLALIFVVSAQEGDEGCRRPPAGWPRRPPQCCDLPFPLENMKKQFGSCIRQAGIGGRQSSTVPTAKAVKDARVCVEECVYKGTGFYNNNGLEKDAITEQLKKNAQRQPLWEKAMDDAVDKCMDDADNASNEEGSNCNETPHVFTNCLLRQLFLNCPSSMWNNSAECNLVKDRMKVCPNILPPPPPPPQQQQRPGPPQQ